MKRIFISYNYQDKEVVRSFKSMLASNGGVIDGELLFVDENLSVKGPSAIDREINTVISLCSHAFFVVGDNSHNSPWINREAELSISKGLNISILRLPRSSGGVPLVLKDFKFNEIEWNPKAINEVLK